MPPELATRARRLFAEQFGAPEPAGVAFAPGRVNLIGEHTDYNEGFVLPMAIDRGVVVAYRPRTDRVVDAYAAVFDQRAEIRLDGLRPGTSSGWSAYLAGVAWALETAGERLPGLDLAIDSDLPIGAGLASSAALEGALARAFSDAAGFAWDPIVMAQQCRRAEHEFVGVPCGLMDQLAATVSREGSAMLLDCRSLEITPVPIPEDTAVVIMDTGVRRALASGAYRERRTACEAAVAVLRSFAPRITALRDADAQLLEEARDRLDPVVYGRARHVVEENRRPAAMARALSKGDLSAAGRLMNESHASLRHLFEVSSVELDRITELARAHPACYGARMTGAGFGGCAIALVRRAGVNDFVKAVEGAYRREVSKAGTLFVPRAEAGARIVE